IGARRRTEIAERRRGRIAAAEQIVQEAAAALWRRRSHGRILRSAIILRERGHHRAALVFAIVATETAAAQALEVAGDLIEVGAHLLDLVVDRTALRRAIVEQREEAGRVAAHALGLRGDAVELALLLGGGVLVAADLLVLGGIAAAAAAVDCRKLRFQPRTDRIDRGRRARSGRARRRRRRRGRRARAHLGERAGVQCHAANEDGAGKG